MININITIKDLGKDEGTEITRVITNGEDGAKAEELLTGDFFMSVLSILSDPAGRPDDFRRSLNDLYDQYASSVCDEFLEALLKKYEEKWMLIKGIPKN